MRLDQQSNRFTRSIFVLALLGCLSLTWLSHSLCAAENEPPRTTAEASDYQKTSSHAEVVEFGKQLAKQSTLVRIGKLGVSHEGRELPLLILADPPVSTPEEAARTEKLVIFVWANIHAGEVDGKEALLALARDLALANERPLLKDLILVFAPILNADGNEKLDKNRPEQAGPELVGTRANGQQLDLNRDFVKLESPEIRAAVKFVNEWDPAVIVDCHTTNGSYHRYSLTYEGGRSPAGDPRVVDYLRDVMLPRIGCRVKESTGLDTWYYGDFANDHTEWATANPTPRFSTHYFGLRNRLTILSESYSYAKFADRVKASYAFVHEICRDSAANKDEIKKLLATAREEAIKTGKAPTERDQVVLRHRAAPVGEAVKVLGYVEKIENDKTISTGEPRDYDTRYMGGAAPTLTVRLPFAYLIPSDQKKAIELLQRHGIEVEELREELALNVETNRVKNVSVATPYQQHRPLTLETTVRQEDRQIPAGTIIVKTSQPLGRLAAYLLEPMAADGLAHWNAFGETLQPQSDFPVSRLLVPVPLLTAKLPPLTDERKPPQPITRELVTGDHPPNFAGHAIHGIKWLEDGNHYLHFRDGKYYKIEAITGKAEPLFDQQKLADGLATLPVISKDSAKALAESAGQRFDPQHQAALFTHEDDLYYCRLDGAAARRLTNSPGAEELATFSPDGKFVAFVRANNLYSVDVAAGTERALTTDGADLIFNGKADWVYYEEVFDRHYQAYWWSPDSSRIVFLRTDDAPVKKYTLVDPTQNSQSPEITPYPKSGSANPLVTLGIVTVAGGKPRWVDLSDYTPTDLLLISAGWTPDSQSVWFYAQNRTQTWLDVCTAGHDGGEVKRLLRDNTGAWVNNPGPLKFLKDGSFLLASERTGWKHLYHYAVNGELKRAITGGEWEARELLGVDNEARWVYFTGTRDSPIAVNGYRARLDNEVVERVTPDIGEHQLNLNSTATLFINTHSSHNRPPRVELRKSDGALGRMLDINPVSSLTEYRRGEFELLQIPTPDGAVLEASLLKPANFDPAKKYPVWMMVYGGPQMPSIVDSWGSGRLRDEMLAELGFLVFKCDPRSASGKGAKVAWTAYKQLGVGELRDLETAVDWLTKKPFVDAERIGISGHSYGGFITAFALTHSKRFAAGVSGAPVTDWRYYDSIYTERYMLTPQDNPDGYNATSVVKAAGNLHGKLLLVHGLLDDNVHAQNSLDFLKALQDANRDFEVMVYPQARHGIYDKHYGRLQIDFMIQALKPEK